MKKALIVDNLSELKKLISEWMTLNVPNEQDYILYVKARSPSHVDAEIKKRKSVYEKEELTDEDWRVITALPLKGLPKRVIEVLSRSRDKAFSWRELGAEAQVKYSFGVPQETYVNYAAFLHHKLPYRLKYDSDLDGYKIFKVS